MTNKPQWSKYKLKHGRKSQKELSAKTDWFTDWLTDRPTVSYKLTQNRTTHLKYARLKFCGGQAYDSSSDDCRYSIRYYITKYKA
jgi:hypothetical protein